MKKFVSLSMMTKAVFPPPPAVAESIRNCLCKMNMSAALVGVIFDGVVSLFSAAVYMTLRSVFAFPCHVTWGRESSFNCFGVHFPWSNIMFRFPPVWEVFWLCCSHISVAPSSNVGPRRRYYRLLLRGSVTSYTFYARKRLTQKQSESLICYYGISIYKDVDEASWCIDWNCTNNPPKVSKVKSGKERNNKIIKNLESRLSALAWLRS